MIFYSCPRPVYFVSVDDGRHSNLFPMDLVGPLRPGHLTLALIGDVPAQATQLAYELGKHHKQPVVDWQGLSVPLIATPNYGLRLPQVAQRIREADILDHLPLGSHTLFLARPCSEQAVNPGPQLFHTSGAYQGLRRRQSRAFEEAPTKPGHATVGH